MNIQQARDVASQWVTDVASAMPAFRGAFYHGSSIWLPDTTELDATSDIDIVVVIDALSQQPKVGKFLYRDVLLDVSYLPWDQCRSPELILANHSIAGSFRNPDMLADPTGDLARIQIAVAADYARRKWVYKRCESARGRIIGFLDTMNASAPLHDNVTAWLFATGVTTHVLLVAGLENPTVRKRYVAVRELLAEYGQSEFYESLLALLGCAQMRRHDVEKHLPAMTAAFDAAVAVGRTPLPFSSDLTKAARPISIDGTRKLVEHGDHREAIFWMVATYARCQKVLFHDAPEHMQETHTSGFMELLSNLGITSFADLQLRDPQVRSQLPRVWELAEKIIDANTDVED